MKFRQAVHVAVGNDFAHEPGERVAGSEFHHLSNPGSAARLHTRSPLHRLLDLTRQLVGAGINVEHRGPGYATQQAHIGRHLSGKLCFVQGSPEALARIRKQWRVRSDGDAYSLAVSRWRAESRASRHPGTPRYCVSNLIASCAQPDTGGPFDEVSGR
jgi:hypothetical protein